MFCCVARPRTRVVGEAQIEPAFADSLDHLFRAQFGEHEPNLG